LKKIFNCQILEREKLLTESFKEGNKLKLKEILGNEIPEKIIETI